MRLYYQNLVSIATITASTANAEYPASNVVHIHPSKVWKTTGTQATETLTFDLGTAQNITAFIAYGTNFDGTETGIALSGSSSNSFLTSTSYGLTLSGTTLSATLTASYRYWRLTFTKANATDIRSIGNIYLGTYVDATDPSYSNTKITANKRSVSGRSIGGQYYGTYRKPYKTWAIPFDSIIETDAAKYRALSDTVADCYPFYFQLSPTVTGFTNICYGVLTGAYTETNKGFDGRILWDVDLKIDELV
jgi:hypothetical protein